jgi:hypothetical protein
MPQFLGRATIRVNGSVIETAKGATLNVGGVKRTPVISGRLVGYAEETVAATVECETSLRNGMSIDALRGLAGATITFECDTGQRYVIGDAFITEPPTMKDGDGGNVALKFAGPAAEEVL